MRSIRSFLLTRLLGGAAVVLALAGFVVYLVVAHSLERQFDENLADRVQGFASILFQDGDHVEFEFSDELMPEYGEGPTPAYFVIRFADGRLIERSISLHGVNLDVPVEPGPLPAFWSARLPDGRPGRFVARTVEVHHVYPEEGPGRPAAAHVEVVIARGREELVAATRTVLLGCVAVFLVVLGGLAVLAGVAVARGLRPAARLAAALDGLRLHDLPESLELGAVPVELAPMSATIEALVQRIRKALERERRTTADIAHELRTPISELIALSDVALRDRRDGDGPRRALRSARAVAWRMGRSVSTLLELARLDMGAKAAPSGEADLARVAREGIDSLADAARERGVRVDLAVEAGEGIVVRCDPEALRIVVTNLLENAVHHGPRDAAVTCRIAGTEEAWSVTVENAAGDLRLEDLPALVEPFWQKDPARSDPSRAGLGLALSHALAVHSGMRLSFALEEGRFRAVLGGDRPALRPDRDARNGEARPGRDVGVGSRAGEA